jgi:hypothetical protein
MAASLMKCDRSRHLSSRAVYSAAPFCCWRLTLCASDSLPIALRSPTIDASGIDSLLARRFQFIAPGGVMVAVQSGISRACFMLAIALSLSFLSTISHAYTPEQQQACSGDAFRLCGDAIPDVGRVTACMMARKSQLSSGCRVFFRSPEPVATRAGTAHRPVRITPGTARKPVHVKPKKPKKTVRPASAT